MAHHHSILDYGVEADEQSDIPIVDAHQHFWDLEGPLYYPWLVHAESVWLGDYSSIRRTYLPSEFRRDVALHRVVGTVHVEAECDKSKSIEETQWLHTLREETGLPTVMVAHAWIDTPDAEEAIAKQASFPFVRGIRTKPIVSAGPGESVAGQPRSMQDPKWLKGLEIIQRHGLSWDFRVPWWHLNEAAAVAREYPDLRIILNHTGYPWDRTREGLAHWRAGMTALAESKNVYCKLSSFCIEGEPWTLKANRQIILDAISIFGVDRCLFASNFPVDSVKVTWDYLFQSFKAIVSHLPMATQRRLFAENAIDAYRIDPAILANPKAGFSVRNNRNLAEGDR